jgi:hypothetical protein
VLPDALEQFQALVYAGSFRHPRWCPLRGVNLGRRRVNRLCAEYRFALSRLLETIAPTYGSTLQMQQGGAREATLINQNLWALCPRLRRRQEGVSAEITEVVRHHTRRTESVRVCEPGAESGRT